MSRHGAHEDLLVRARRGELGEAEERRLEAALQSSRELALLYEAGVEFDRGARLLPGDEARMNALVERTLARLEAQGRLSSSSRDVAQSRWSSRRLMLSALRVFAASLVLGSLLSFAFAKGWEYARREQASPQRVAEAQSAPARTAAPRSARQAAGTAEPEPALPAEAPDPAQSRAGEGRAVSSTGQPRGLVSAPPKAVEPLAPSELFARASEARRKGDIEGAIALYESLCNAHPDSIEARDARLLLGNLRLGQRAPREALQEFENYGAGALTLEALWGRAQALRKLGSPEERAVLERLLREHPSSPYEAAARKRLQQLPP